MERKCNRCPATQGIRKVNHRELWLCLECRTKCEGVFENPHRNITVACQAYEEWRKRYPEMPPFYTMRQRFKNLYLTFGDIAVLCHTTTLRVKRAHQLFFSGWLDAQSDGMERLGKSTDGRFAAAARANFSNDPKFQPLIAWAKKFGLKVECVPIDWARNNSGYSRYFVRINGVLTRLQQVTAVHQGFHRMIVGELGDAEVMVGQFSWRSRHRFFTWLTNDLRHYQHINVLSRKQGKYSLRENDVAVFNQSKKRMAKALLPKTTEQGSVAS